MKSVVAVIGGAHASPEVLTAAEELGRRLIDAGCRIVTGGLSGVMEAACRGARSSPAWRDGDIIGVLPGLDSSAVNPFVDIAIVTGLNHARNVVVAATADVVVAVGGGAGTLSEMAHAWQHGKRVIGLRIGGGWSDRLAGEPLDDRRADVVQGALNAEDAVRLVVVALGGPRGAARLGF